MRFSDEKNGVNTFTLQEILVYLACQGAFNNYQFPGWAKRGSDTEQVWLALQHLGRSKSNEESGGEGFDEWFANYCLGLEVSDSK